jgi:hypothetical protein
MGGDVLISQLAAGPTSQADLALGSHWLATQPASGSSHWARSIVQSSGVSSQLATSPIVRCLACWEPLAYPHGPGALPIRMPDNETEMEFWDMLPTNGQSDAWLAGRQSPWLDKP